MTAFRQKRELPPLLRGPRGLVFPLVLGLLASFLAAFDFEKHDQESERADLLRRQVTAHDSLLKSLRAVENTVFALRLVATHHEDYTHEDFLGAARSLLEHTPGIACLQWVANLDAASVPAFLANVRTAVRPDFVLKQRSARGEIGLLDTSQLSPDTSLSVITYLYPIEGNENAYGYNVTQDIAARENADTRRTGAIMATGIFPLVEGYPGMVLTAYTARPPDSDPEQGPGYTQAVLRLDTLLADSLDPSSWQGMDFGLYDLTEGSPAALYTHLRNQASAEANPVPFAAFTGPRTVLRDLTFGGRRWVTAYRSPAGSLLPFTSIGAWGIFVLGAAATFLGVAYLWLILRRDENIRQEVATRTSELKDSRTLLDLIVDHNPCSIWMKDSELRLQLVNQTFCSYYGRSKAALLGLTDADLHAPDTAAEMQAIDREVLASGIPQRYEFPASMEGKQRFFLTSKFAIRLNDGTGLFLVGIAQEITELREAETRRIEIERKMLEAQKLESLGVLAGGIAHDFNNILTAILGHAGLASSNPHTDPGTLKSIKQIELAARRAGELCHQMLAYAGRHRLSTGPLDLGALIGETLPLLEVSLPKSARLSLQLSPDLPSVVADPTQIRQILMNLLLNAAEALPPAGGEISVKTSLVHADAKVFAACIHQPPHPAGPYVCLEVTDTGSGMSPETLAKIFDPFFTTKFTGRGLGLASLLGIVRGHKGAIRVVSQPGVGTSFFIYLPASTTLAPAPAMTAPLPLSAKRTILLIEDEPSVRETTRLMLEALDCTVVTADDGPAGVDIFRKNPARPTLVLLDLTMPGLSGREVFSLLRADRSDLPILLISGYSELDAEDMLAEPKTDFLAKPFTLNELREKIASPRLA